MKTPMQLLVDEIKLSRVFCDDPKMEMDIWHTLDVLIAKGEVLLEKEKESHKENYIAGYLDNGYYEGAEEDAAKIWQETYGFNYNETFNTK